MLHSILIPTRGDGACGIHSDFDPSQSCFEPKYMHPKPRIESESQRMMLRCEKCAAPGSLLDFNRPVAEDVVVISEMAEPLLETIRRPCLP
jgi:hypothetical protein